MTARLCLKIEDRLRADWQSFQSDAADKHRVAGDPAVDAALSPNRSSRHSPSFCCAVRSEKANSTRSSVASSRSSVADGDFGLNDTDRPHRVHVEPTIADRGSCSARAKLPAAPKLQYNGVAHAVKCRHKMGDLRNHNGLSRSCRQ